MGESQSSEQLLRGGGTDRPARDDANGPEERPPVLPEPGHGTGTSPSLILTHKPSKILTTHNKQAAFMDAQAYGFLWNELQ